MPHKKILFLNPPLSLDHRYGSLSAAGAAEPPLGLAYLAAVTRKNGFNTGILDAQALGLGVEGTFDLIVKEQPDFLAITLSAVSLTGAVRLASMIKEKEPRTIIIVGGNHFSALPEETLRENGCFDIGVVGEGEKSLEKLLLAIVAVRPLSAVEGIAFRSKDKVILTAPVEHVEKLDDLPMPAFDLLPDIARYYRPAAQSIKYLPAVSLVTSRGCPGRCLFCDKKTFGKNIRMHGAEYVVDMMEKLNKDHGVKGIIFEDDNFMLSEERLSELAKEIRRRKVRVAWSALSRVDTITDEKIRIAKSCGCWQILFGIESGSQKILDFYKKGITLAQIRKAVALAKKHRVYTKGFFIVGNPLESRETLLATRNLVMELPLDDISMTYFTPYPGSEIWDQVDRYGTFDKAWDRLSCFDPVFIPWGMSRDEICDFQMATYREFYAQVRVITSYVRRLRSFSQAVMLLRSFWSFREHLRGEPPGRGI